MRGTLAALLAPALLLAVASAAPVPKERSKGEVHFPARVGATWVYRWLDRTDETVEVVTAVDPADRATVVSVGRVSGGKVNPDRRVAVSPRGLFKVGDGDGPALDPTARLLALPPTPGADWVGRPLGPVDGTFAIAGVERVEVPAGRFEAVRVEWDGVPNGRRVRITSWYAKGVGLVKMTVRSGNLERVQVLKSFAPGKD